MIDSPADRIRVDATADSESKPVSILAVPVLIQSAPYVYQHAYWPPSITMGTASIDTGSVSLRVVDTSPTLYR